MSPAFSPTRRASPGCRCPDSGDFWNLADAPRVKRRAAPDQGESHYRAGIAAPEAIAAMQLYADMILKEKTALAYELGTRQSPCSSAVRSRCSRVEPGSRSAPRGAAISRWSQYRFRPSAISRVASRWRATTTSSSPPRPDEQAASWALLKFLNSPQSITNWIENTGFLPPILGLTEDPRYLQPYFDKSAPLRIDLEQMPDMTPRLSWPGANGLEAAKALSDTREKIVTGVQDVATALAEAATLIDALIND